MNYCRYQTTKRNIFTQFGNGTKCWLEIYHWGAGLAVTGRIRGIGQNVLEPSFIRGRSSSPSYCQIFFLFAFLEEALIRNIIIILFINYVIIMCINNDNAVTNNKHEKRRSSMIWNPHQILLGDEIEKIEMGVACGVCGGGERRIQGFGGETWGKESTWKTQT